MTYEEIQDMSISAKWDIVLGVCTCTEEQIILNYIASVYGYNYEPLDLFLYSQLGYHVDQFIELILGDE